MPKRKIEILAYAQFKLHSIVERSPGEKGYEALAGNHSSIHSEELMWEIYRQVFENPLIGMLTPGSPYMDMDVQCDKKESNPSSPVKKTIITEKWWPVFLEITPDQTGYLDLLLGDTSSEGLKQAVCAAFAKQSKIPTHILLESLVDIDLSMNYYTDFEEIDGREESVTWLHFAQKLKHELGQYLLENKDSQSYLVGETSAFGAVLIPLLWLKSRWFDPTEYTCATHRSLDWIKFVLEQSQCFPDCSKEWAPIKLDIDLKTDVVDIHGKKLGNYGSGQFSSTDDGTCWNISFLHT